MIVDCAAYTNGKRVNVDPDPLALKQWAEEAELGRPAADFLWLGLRMPDEAELGAACAALWLDDVSPTDLLVPHSRPVLTIDGDRTELVLRTARYDEPNETVVLGEMTLVSGPRSILSVRHGQASPLAAVRNRLEADPERLRLGPMAVLVAVVQRVIDDYGPALDGFENDVIEVESEVFSGTKRQPVQRLYRLKREVRRLLVAIDALDDPLRRLIRAVADQQPEELVADLYEAADQLDRAVTRANSLSGLLDAALTASLTQITVQQNDDMRRISAWVAMAAVPTLIAGIYGMNFEAMPELSSQLGYPAVLAVMAGVVLALYRWFKRSGWL